METSTTTAAAAAPNRHCRSAKWNGSLRCIRIAAAGLEVKDSTTPMAIRIRVEPSSQRSAVHHHTPMDERSERLKA